MRATLATLMAASLVAITACTEAVPTGPSISPAGLLARKAVVTEPGSGPWARVVEGETGPGSLYAIYVPRQPNGDAVFYAHGIRDAYKYVDRVPETTLVDLRDQDSFFALRDRLGAMGYTVAYSSFSVNGFAVKDGAQRTHQLRGLVASELSGQPRRSFLVGHSLGGAIGVVLAEKYPDQYDGALLMCGMVGGSLLQTQYIGNVRALFDAFYPGRLEGSILVSPRRPITIPEIAGIVASNPIGLLAIASAEQTQLPIIPVGSVFDPTSPIAQTLVGSLFGALSFHARGIENVLDITNGHSPFDNEKTEYRLGRPVVADPGLVAMIGAQIAAANGRVERVAIDPSAQSYLEHHFTPTGDLRIPVLTVHNTWDPGVPEFHEGAFAKRVADAGASSKLLRRQVPRFGHCAITSDEAAQSFADLEKWVSTGVRPAN